jgi:hypothetical protein
MTSAISTHRRALCVRPLATCLALACASVSSDGGSHAPSPSLDSPGKPPGHAATLSTDAVPASALAVTRVVKNCNDSGPDSLREAYSLAGNNDQIDLRELACSRITLNTGALSQPAGADAANVFLQGPLQGQLVVDGGGIDRVVLHRGTGTLYVTNLTITNGHHVGTTGGCIYSAGSVRLIDSNVSSCQLMSTTFPATHGGAIFAKNDVSLLFSSVTGSTAYATAPGSHAAGGGVWAKSVSLVASSISGNSAVSAQSYSLGGGVYATGNVAAAYSTISGNYATEGGGTYSNTLRTLESTVSGNGAIAVGGLYARSSASIYNSTIVNNTAVLDQFAGGVHVFSSNIKLESSIIADNTAGTSGSDVGSYTPATIVGANNLIMNHAAAIIVPADTISDDPKLGPLQNNGGPTLTHALLTNSPAIDKGNVGGFSQDQRLFPRVVGSSADIGAFEFVDAIFVDGFDPHS